MTTPDSLRAAADVHAAAWTLDLAALGEAAAARDAAVAELDAARVELEVLRARVAELEAAQPAPTPPAADPVLWRGSWPWAGSMRSRLGNGTGTEAGVKVTYKTDTANNDGYTGHGLALRSDVGDLGVAAAEDLTLTYRVWLPADWQPFEGGKLPGLGGHGDLTELWKIPSGGQTSYLGRAFSARLMWKKPADGNPDHSRLFTYLYVVAAAGGPMPTNPANGIPYGVMVEFRADGQALWLKRGGWNEISTRVRMNTPGRADGIFQASLNGVPGVDLRDVLYRSAGYPGLQVDALLFDTFYGGPTANRTQQVIDFADVTIRSG